MKLARTVFRLLSRGLVVIGAITVLTAAWLIGGLPLYVDRLVVEDGAPMPAAAIVCIAGGLGAGQLPLDVGWTRIYTAVQLQADGFAPTIVFSGGGTGRVSEAEVYAQAARWLGAPADRLTVDPFPGGTAEHPANLLKVETPRIRTDTPLLVVTSRLHSKRTALCFRKAGFTNIRLVTSYEAEGAGAAVNRSRLESAFAGFRPSGKRYDDPLNRLRWGFDDLFITLRELAAIGVYKYQGRA
jgi:uncharacterized SAM-binding protein YcdF (DUF218 family)